MKNRKLYILAVLLIALFSFNIAYAMMPEEGHKMDSHGTSDLMEQIKEKKQIIKHHKEVNEKLEKQIEEKIDIMEQLLAKHPKENMAGKEEMQRKLKEKMKAHMNHMKEIEKVEMHIAKCLNMAHKHMAEHKPEACIKMMDKAIEALEKKHHMLVELNKSLDEFIEFLKSLDYK